MDMKETEEEKTHRGQRAINVALVTAVALTLVVLVAAFLTLALLYRDVYQRLEAMQDTLPPHRSPVSATVMRNRCYRIVE